MTISNYNINLDLYLNEEENYRINQNDIFINYDNYNEDIDKNMNILNHNNNNILLLTQNQTTAPKTSAAINKKAKPKENQKACENNKNTNSINNSERERRITSKLTKKYCESESPKKSTSSLHNLNRAKQVIQAYKLNINDYKPCQDHEGDCTTENCVCAKNRSACEKFCFCSESCKSEFPGCFCVNGCNASCSCATNMRECDPDICKCCAFSNLYNDNINNKIVNKSEFNDINLNLFVENDMSNNINLFFDCGNCEIFLGKKKKTCVSNSLVAESYGLFAYEDIEKDEFICEYIGELLSKEETDRRSVFNDQLGLNYFFKLNDAYDIDAYAIGNEMRYFLF
jgi:hypothetical protein